MNGSTLRTHAAHRDTWRSLLRVLGLCLSLAVAGGLLSCYKPDFSTAIYKCDVYTCPKGQVCNTDQLCVQFPVEGCLNGGFSVEDDVYLCPGVNNSCTMAFDLCVEPPAEGACSPDALKSAAATCKVCCRR